jgi:hypothetical protein
MARTINSPGIQITETDLSDNIQTPAGTAILAMGFANQGPVDEVLSITTQSELELIYGTPTTTSERYFYHTVKELLNSPATVLTSRLPYGSGSGEGFSEYYSALFFPVASSESGFVIGEPLHKTFSDLEYASIVQGETTWAVISSTTFYNEYSATPTASFEEGQINAGFVVINKSQTTSNEALEGYYLAVTDNRNIGPETDFDSVVSLQGLTNNSQFTTIPETKLNFALSGTFATAGAGSVSEIIEGIPTFNFGDPFYKDSLIFSLFKVRASIYEPQVLSTSLVEAHIGSFDSRKKTVTLGGSQRSFFIEDVVNNTSNNLQVLVHPSIANTNWTNLTANEPQYSLEDETKSLYGAGVYTPQFSATSKKLGAITRKVERVLSLVDSNETVNIDVVVDGGLSTINAIASDEVLDSYNDSVFVEIDNTVRTRWRSIFNTFNNFCQNVRKDCMFIADPLRHIFVNGSDSKTLSIKSKNFTSDIYTPLKDLFKGINSSYSTTYANWVKSFDTFQDRAIWLPPSPFVGAAFARTDESFNPWIAPAGLTRGVLNNIIDIGITPNQKQRDFLYTISLNPIVFFNTDGFAIYGQKTLQTKPSAFDRINVRRLFLSLEKAVQSTLRTFVFEPNTDFTRSRLVNTITPIFENAQATDGIFEFLIVCDERNNTPASIDANELRVDIYIKPVRAAEFILVNFIATRTNQSFEEII